MLSNLIPIPNSFVRVSVRVRFGPRVVIRESQGVIEAVLTKKPERGEANKQLVKLLAKHYNTSTASIRIISGLKSRTKVVEILK